MCSLEGEVVPLRNLVRISSLVEVKSVYLNRRSNYDYSHFLTCLLYPSPPTPSPCLFQVWLSELSAEMKETLKQLLYECVSAGRKGAVDPSRYPSQVLKHFRQAWFVSLIYPLWVCKMIVETAVAAKRVQSFGLRLLK